MDNGGGGRSDIGAVTERQENIVASNEKQTWWTDEIVKATGEMIDVWMEIEGIKGNGGQLDISQHLYR